MFASIRRALSAAIAPKATTTTTPTNLTAAAYQPAALVNGRPIPTISTRKTINHEGIDGTLSADAIKGLSSDTLRKSMVGKLVYSTIAQAWNAHRKTLNRNGSIHQKEADKTLQNAAEAVSISDSLGYPVELSVETFAFLLTAGVPAELSEKNAALLSSITGQSHADMKAKRDAKRAATFQSNMEHLTIFLDSVASCTGSVIDKDTGEVIETDATPELKGASAISALASCVEFITTWSDDIRMAAELMLIQADRVIIERELATSARREAGRAPDYVRAIDEQLLSADGMAAGMSSGK